MFIQLKRLGILFGIALTILAGTGCSSLIQSVVKSPEVRLDEVRVENLGLQTADLIFQLEVFNPNAVNLKIDSVDYKLVLNDKPFADGHINKAAELPANKKVMVDVPIKVEFKRVFDSLFAAFQKPETKYVLSGTAKLGPFSVPFNKKGTMKWTENQ